MKFGLSLTCAGPAGGRHDAAGVYRAHLETAQLADELGFNTVVVAEHHFLANGWCPAPIAMATAIAARTSRIRVGSGIVILPLFDPVRLAEEVALLDVISSGRAVVGIGMGYRRQEFAGYGIAFEERLGRWQESLEVLPRLLAGEPVTFTGRYVSFEDAKVRPAPVQRPHPPIWVGSTGEATIRRAARSGHSIYLGNAAPRNAVARRISWFRDELARVGRSPEGVEVPIMRELYVAPGREEALEAMRPSLELAYHHELIELGWGIPIVDAEGNEAVTTDPSHPAASVEALSADRCLIGSPDECVARIRDYERAGVTELLFRVHHPHIAQDAVVNSLRLFAEGVMPAFREDAE